MKHPRFEYDVDADVDRRKLERSEAEDMSPDEYRKSKYGVDGTKLFICQVTPGVYTVKAMGRQHGATTKERIMEIVSQALTERFGL